MEDMLFVVLGVSGGTILLCGAWGLRCLVMGLLGYEELPKLRLRKKIPRKVAASRGMVGQRIRRTEYIYLDIVPQTDPRVKGLQVRKHGNSIYFFVNSERSKIRNSIQNHFNKTIQIIQTSMLVMLCD